MNFTRFFLYTALAVITYLMLLAWQADYPPQIEESGQRTALRDNNGGNSDLPLPAESPLTADDLPTAPLAQTAPNQDLPAAEPLTQTDTQTQDSGVGRVDVLTDTLQLSIDLTGGDINFLALPEYQRELNGSDDPFVLLHDSNQSTYVTQTGLIGENGIDTPTRATYSAASRSYVMSESEDRLTVDLTAQTPEGVNITKRFSFERGSYLIDISFIVHNNSDSRWQANVFGQIKRSDFDDPSDAGGFGRTYLGFVTSTPDDPYVEIDYGDVEDGYVPHDMMGGWIGFSQHYFLTALIPETDSFNRFSTRRNSANQYFGVFTSEPMIVQPGAEQSYQLRYYAGPKDQYELAEIAPGLDLTIDYGFLWFLAAPIYWLLRQINSVVSNYGVSIILLTVVVKAFFYKLSETQYRSMAGMRRLMPKLQQLKERYSDDRMKLQQETMALYKKEKLNPFGGCLPMLVQMPVFLALYWVLMESVELRHAPFMLWIEDLSVRDPFFVLPLLMGASMFAQTRLSPTPPDPMQAKVMTMMPIMMTALFLWFPAGLVLYWLTNGVLGIAQQWYITRKIEKEYAARTAS